jgi:hypothetical protein
METLIVFGLAMLVTLGALALAIVIVNALEKM